MTFTRREVSPADALLLITDSYRQRSIAENILAKYKSTFYQELVSIVKFKRRTSAYSSKNKQTKKEAANAAASECPIKILTVLWTQLR